MGIFTTSKTQAFIAAAVTVIPADGTAYEALTWIQIASMESIGDVGDSSTPVTFDDIGDGRTKKLKGQRDAGDFSLVCAVDDTDVGQNALRAAQEDDSVADYPIKLILPNKQNPTGTGSVRYFCGKVMGDRESYGSANNVVKFAPTVAITTKIVKKKSTAGV